MRSALTRSAINGEEGALQALVYSLVETTFPNLIWGFLLCCFQMPMSPTEMVVSKSILAGDLPLDRNDHRDQEDAQSTVAVEAIVVREDWGDEESASDISFIDIIEGEVI